MILHPALSLWLLLPLLLSLTIFFIWQEWRRDIRFLRWRIIAVCILMIGVTGLCLRPAYTVSVRNNVLLLTSDYHPATVDSLLKARPDLLPRHVDGATPYKRSTLISSSALEEIKSRIVAIAGDGLPSYALEGVGNYQYYPGNYPEGITSLSTPANIRRNIRQTIGGSYYFKGDNAKLILESPSGREDSAELKTGDNIIQLSFVPRQNGKLSYTMTVLDSGKAYPEHLPLYINPASPLNVLIIQKYPTFEVRYLKNFLQRRNHTLAIRYQLSKQTFRYEFANRESAPLNSITQEMLSGFDVLIVDSKSMSELSAIERSAITASVDGGLGVLTLVHTVPQGTLARDIFTFGVTNIRYDTAVISIGGATYTFPALPIRPLSNAELIAVSGNRSGILSGYTRMGKGHIAFQLLQETYRLLLSGDSTAYGMLWSPLLEQVAKARKKQSMISIDTPLPYYVDEPVRIRVISRHESPGLIADSLEVALLEDPLLDGVWTTTIWHGSPGWHTLTTKAGDSLEYFVSQESEWRGLRKARQQQDNRMLSNRDVVGNHVQMHDEKEYPLIIFYLTFLISAGFLWLAPKL